jgi:hypothetical protein
MVGEPSSTRPMVRTIGRSVYVTLPPPANPPVAPYHFLAYQSMNRTETMWWEWTGVMIFPYWALALAMALPAYLALRTEVRLVQYWRRPRKGLCPVCGYDLRATPHRCPECGTAVRSPPEQSLPCDFS